MTKATCTECDIAVPKGRRSYCSNRCMRAAERKRYRAKRVPMICDHCGNEFMGRRWGKDADHRRRYCSGSCDGQAKAERYMKPCEHGVPAATECLVCSFLSRTELRVAWRNVLRADPCAYCGTTPANGIDHIEPKARHADRSDTENWTGCCKACNETKRALPLLLSLPWIPVSRRYHAMRRERFV